jgi:3-oxoadipate enol-lactonase
MPTTDGPSPRIHYEIRGRQDAPVLVMLRGLGRSRRHWGGVSELLEIDFRLLLVDNRGVGKSEAVRAPYTTAEMAADVVRVLDHAEVPRAHVFGMSLGGMIAQELAIEHPGRIDRLVLGLHDAGRKRSPAGPPHGLRVPRERAPRRRRRLGRDGGALPLERRVSRASPRGDRSVDRDRDRRARRTRHDGAAAPRRRPARREPAPPSHHRPDPHRELRPRRSHPPENSRLLARAVAGAEIAWVAGAAHDFATERPDETARLLRRFLRP